MVTPSIVDILSNSNAPCIANCDYVARCTFIISRKYYLVKTKHGLPRQGVGTIVLNQLKEKYFSLYCSKYIFRFLRRLYRFYQPEFPNTQKDLLGRNNIPRIRHAFYMILCLFPNHRTIL